MEPKAEGEGGEGGQGVAPGEARVRPRHTVLLQVNRPRLSCRGARGERGQGAYGRTGEGYTRLTCCYRNILRTMKVMDGITAHVILLILYSSL